MATTDDLLEVFGALDTNGQLTQFLGAIGGMMTQVDQICEDSDTYVGWEPAFNPTIAPTIAYPFIAMLGGETIPPGTPDATALQIIETMPNQYVGSPQSIANAIKSVLTGGQSVGMLERTDNTGAANDDALWIVTLAAETPNQAAVEQEIVSTVPADIDWYYTLLSNATWATLQTADGPTWADIQTAHGPTWADIEASNDFDWY